MKLFYKRSRLFWTLLLGLICTNVAVAQQVLVKGTVFDKKGETIIGATVTLKGKPTVGMVTDFDGNFQFKADKQDVLVVSYIGYTTKEVKLATAKFPLKITLSDDEKLLSDVVVIGYGTMKKKDLTGSISTIDEKSFQKGAIATPSELLVGKVAGVQITPSGSPGAGGTIRIRSGASLNASNDPLIVIDGVPIDNSVAAGAPSILSSINPQDIASMNILKDASATAIYGSRASNGVIIITTKRAKFGQDLKVNFSTNHSLAQAVKFVDVLKANEYRYFVKKYAPNKVGDLGKANTDWQKEIYQLAYATDNNLSINGSLNRLPYRVSLGYLNQDGILKTDNMKRASASITVNPRFLDGHLSIDANLKFSATKNHFADKSAISDAVQFDPTQPICAEGFDKFGGYYTWMSGDNPKELATPNPVAKLDLRNDESKVWRSLGSAKINYKSYLIPDLRFNLNLGYDYTSSKGDTFVPETAAWEWFKNPGKPGQGGSNNHYEQQKRNLLLDFYANYAKDIDAIKSRIDVMAGYSYQDWKTSITNFPRRTAKGEVIEKVLFPNDYPQNTLVSFYTRLNYSLMNRYLFTATVRADGSSRFSKDNRWGIFPSLAFAWRIKEEGFLKDVEAVNDLKLRLGYGVTGQQDGIKNYSYLPFYNLSSNKFTYQIGDKFYNMFKPDAYDENIKWEQTETYNVGLDYAFLNNRISGSIDAYYKKTKDLLNETTVPAGANFSNILLTNVGNIENKGIEFTINAVPIQTKDFTWDLSYNISFQDSKITKLTASEDPSYVGAEQGGIKGGTGNKVLIHSVNYAPNTFYVFKQLYDKAGNPIEGAYADLNHDGVINDNDRYHYNSAAPDVLMGLSTSFTYKSWTLSTSLRGSLGNYVYDNVSSYMANKSLPLKSDGFLTNTTVEFYDSKFDIAQYKSDYYVHNASFVKMDNLSLSYDFGKVYNKFGLRASATVQNVFTLSDYKGIDPEQTIDYNLYPMPRVYSLNFNLVF